MERWPVARPCHQRRPQTTCNEFCRELRLARVFTEVQILARTGCGPFFFRDQSGNAATGRRVVDPVKRPVRV